MTPAKKRSEIIKYWLSKSEESLESADSEFGEDRLTFAMNRAYYACFYALSALLLDKNLKFSKHSGLRAALHQHIIRPGILPRKLGKIYDELFEHRQEGDYFEFVVFLKENVKSSIKEAKEFVEAIKETLQK